MCLAQPDWEGIQKHPDPPPVLPVVSTYRSQPLASASSRGTSPWRQAGRLQLAHFPSSRSPWASISLTANFQQRWFSRFQVHRSSNCAPCSDTNTARVHLYSSPCLRLWCSDFTPFVPFAFVVLGIVLTSQTVPLIFPHKFIFYIRGRKKNRCFLSRVTFQVPLAIWMRMDCNYPLKTKKCMRWQEFSLRIRILA